MGNENLKNCNDKGLVKDNLVMKAKPVDCRACTERARETPNMACCRCQDEQAFCNNDMGKVRLFLFLLSKSNKSDHFLRVVSNSLLQPAKLPIEDFPVRRNIPGPGLTCQNNLECTLFDDCEEVILTIIEPSLLLRMTAPAELETT